MPSQAGLTQDKYTAKRVVPHLPALLPAKLLLLLASHLIVCTFVICNVLSTNDKCMYLF